VDVRLVVTHRDNPAEAIWFASVAELAARHGLSCITPEDAKSEALLAECRAADADFLFSFYYRHMLPAPLLAVARRGAFNLHGSLLPKYRGRAPVNWAVLHGEHETGASLHVMEVKPDAGAIVDQMAVPILGDDTARQVFDKVTLAAEIVVARSLPRLLAGTARLTPQQHLPGQYFGGRKPEDGRIAPTASAAQIHNLVRAVAPPEYPGAFFDAGGARMVIASTLRVAGNGTSGESFALSAREGALWLDAADGGRLRVFAATLAGHPFGAADFIARFGSVPLRPDA
jgi:methionyl-tRNA formyltransferase